MTLRLLAGLAAALVLGALATRLRGSANTNYRGRTVSLAGGLAAIAVAALGGLSRHDRTGAAILVAALAAGAVGRYDDVKGTTDKGLRGHLRALRHGNVTSGAAKVAVVGLAALAAAAILDKAGPRLLIDAVLVAGTANLLNLFDLRPGRALKVATIASLALLGTDAWLAGAGLGLLPYDLRERTMLGDGGANALGAALGVTIAAAARPLAVAIPLAVALIAATLASEVVSFSKVIDAVRPLRWADRLGRPA